MADDREVLKEIWDGKVPICFSLAQEEIHTVEQPDPLYLLVPRQTYFPLVTDKVHRYFQNYIDAEKSEEMWLEDEGIALKWHYPIGLLFDLAGAESSLPWSIQVHFQNFPEADILHCPNREAVEAHLLSMIKEADSLKHRGQVVNSMQKRDHKQLWIGLQNDKFDQFWAVNRKLMETPNDDFFKHIPFRIYLQDKPFIQKLYRPVSESGQVLTLGDLLKEMIPETLETDNGKQVYKFVIQGIETPLDSSIQWLSEHFSHPDNFLHICAVSLKT